MLKKGWFKRQYNLAIEDIATWPQWMKDNHFPPQDCSCKEGQLHYERTDPQNQKQIYQCDKCGKLELISS